MIWPGHGVPSSSNERSIDPLLPACSIRGRHGAMADRTWTDGDKKLAADAEAARRQFRVAKANGQGGAATASGGGKDDDAEIVRLRALPPLLYGRERKEAERKLGISVAILDRLAYGNGNTNRSNGKAVQGRPLTITEIEPFGEAVDGADLLDDMVAAIRSYAILHGFQADAIALWIIGTHAMAAWTIFPRLMIQAPTRGCGKSTLVLDVLPRLVNRPRPASGISTASLFRTIELLRETLLLDEADTYVRDNEEMRGVLNAGHHRDATVIRTIGDDHEPREFSVWAPVALAAIGRLPGTIEDRSIIIHLRKKRADEKIESVRDTGEQLDRLARKAARFVRDHLDVLAGARPKMPDGVINRDADNWHPLLAIADIAGGEWSARARRACDELFHNTAATLSPGVLLLGDLRELFDAKPLGVLFTNEILPELHKRDDRPWPEYGKKQLPITSRQVASLLKPFEIPTNQTVWRGTATSAKGYRREDFEDVFARYLPPPMGEP
jgi:hypothetical protein